MPECFTCGEPITFDKNILSKTGKQIPLWLDKQDAHGHDKDTGKPIRQPLPNQFPKPLEQQPQRFQQVAKTLSDHGQQSTSQGGSYMDTKRLRVMTEELSKEVHSIHEQNEALYQLTKSNNGMLGELLQYFKITDPKSAAELYKSMNKTKQEALKKEPGEVKGWNSVPNNMPTIDESRDFPIEETLKDDLEEDDSITGDNKGVIDEL